eukprot:356997-Chlamydomonas_euryale.AAC.1
MEDAKGNVELPHTVTAPVTVLLCWLFGVQLLSIVCCQSRSFQSGWRGESFSLSLSLHAVFLWTRLISIFCCQSQSFQRAAAFMPRPVSTAFPGHRHHPPVFPRMFTPPRVHTSASLSSSAASSFAVADSDWRCCCASASRSA